MTGVDIVEFVGICKSGPFACHEHNIVSLPLNRPQRTTENLKTAAGNGSDGVVTRSLSKPAKPAGLLRQQGKG